VDLDELEERRMAARARAGVRTGGVR
jgi:hypothetical protein